MKIEYLIIFILSFFNCSAIAQFVAIKGKVIDKKSNLELSGVMVKVGDDIAKTDERGNFILNVWKATSVEKGINFSLVGYFNAQFIYEPNHFYDIQLIENIMQLKEVLIVNGGEIVKKAIDRIPDNYPDKPAVLKGILRTQSWRNQSEYFKSDALIEAYVPSYSGNQKTVVKVIRNKIDTIFDKSLQQLRQTSNYNVVDFQDIAHSNYILNKISKKKRFDYLVVGKQDYNGNKVFVINTTLKDTAKTFNRIEATLYIDTATYAFVAANVNTYNLVRDGLLTIDILNYRVEYEKFGDKWYLKETHFVAEAKLKKQTPQIKIDFVRHEIDSLNVKKFFYKDIIQAGDNILLIDVPVSEDIWSVTDTLFRKAESEGKIAVISNELLDIIRHNSAVSNTDGLKNKKSFSLRVIDYLSKDNVRKDLVFKKFPVLVESNLYNVPKIINYAISYGISYRFYKNMFFGIDGSRNLWNGKKINLFTLSANISNEFVFNKFFRGITLRPYLGFGNINVGYDKAKLNMYSINGGLKVSYELTHKLAIIFSTSFNPALDRSILNGLNIQANKYAIGLGVLFKR